MYAYAATPPPFSLSLFLHLSLSPARAHKHKLVYLTERSAAAGEQRSDAAKGRVAAAGHAARIARAEAWLVAQVREKESADAAEAHERRLAHARAWLLAQEEENEEQEERLLVNEKEAAGAATYSSTEPHSSRSTGEMKAQGNKIQGVTHFPRVTVLLGNSARCIDRVFPSSSSHESVSCEAATTAAADAEERASKLQQCTEAPSCDQTYHDEPSLDSTPPLTHSISLCHPPFQFYSVWCRILHGRGCVLRTC